MTGHRPDIDFMSELDAAARLHPAKHSNILLWTIAALIGFLVVWAAVADVEIITRGRGQVVPGREIQLVQSLEGGILAELRVKEGDRVAKGDVLARIENVAFASEERGIEAQSLALRLTQMRLRAEIDNENFVIPDDVKALNEDLAANELALYKARQAQLNNALSIADENIRKSEANLNEIGATIARLSESRRLLGREMEITRGLVAKNAMPELEAIRLERELADVKGNLAAAIERKSALQAELAAARRSKADEMAAFRSEALAEMSEVETRLSAIQESLTAVGDKVDRTELRAPSDGIVKTISQKTIGGVVEPAMRLIEIVPIDDALKINARVSPADIAFLKVGQPVNVKITAYDPQRFGSLKGELSRIGVGSMKDDEGNIYFEIDVVTNKTYLGSEQNPLPIIPGMVAETEVITGKRTILSYLLKPFLRARDRALTEQ